MANDVATAEIVEVEVADVDVNGLVVVEVDDSAMWRADGEIPAEPGIEQRYPKCPNPTKWRVVGQAKARGGFHQVSAAVSAKAAPVTHRFKVQRSVTFSAAVTAGVKVGIPGLEGETGLKLETSVTVTTSESLTYTVPKGSVMALFAGPGYVIRNFSRVTYGSAMCNQVVQTTQVSSPYMKIFEVRNV